MSKWWIAHARGCNFALLRGKGFLTLYPAIDDYVFLQSCSDNLKLTRKQQELGVHFLKTAGQLVEIDQKEIDRMVKNAKDDLKAGDEILAVDGIAAGLTGVIDERNGDEIKCTMNGLLRTYEVCIDRMDVVPKPEEDNARPDPVGGREPANLRDL